VGWVSPDNPSKPPVIKIVRPDKTSITVRTNHFRPDVRDAGMHPTGHNGFVIDSKQFPALAPVLDQIEVVDETTGVLLYRPYDEKIHLPLKIFRLELQAMPYAQIEAAWDRNFSLYYNAVERYPFETLFTILNNPTTRSIALAGRPSFQRYSALFRDRDYKIVTLLKHPLEEMAERLLFLRYILTPAAPQDFRVHLSGLHPLALAVKSLDFDDPDSVASFFSSLSFQQKAALENPVVKVLACNVNETPSQRHVELALANLSGLDVVGVGSRRAEFRQMLTELLGRDIYGDGFPNLPAAIKVIADGLAEVKAARELVALDTTLFDLVEAAIGRALPVPDVDQAREAMDGQ
jgi:hypothetical protein